jgi:outer membrane protein assembly factor BamB
MGKWKQFHMDGQNQGFAAVRTAEALTPRWSVEVGPVGYGSPVIGSDNTIYIGTLLGELVAINPDGTIKWRRALRPPGSNHPGPIVGSPAIGNDGNIYVISTVSAIIRDHRSGETTTRRVRRSTLFSVDPLGNTRWNFQFPANPSPSGIGGYTTSSPKVWGEAGNVFILVPAVYWTSGHAVELIVLNGAGTALQRVDIASYPPEPIVGEGHGLGDLLNAVWDFISSPVDFDTSGVPQGPSLEKQFGFPEPTIAIVDFGSFKDQPLILFEDGFKKVSCFRFEAPVLVPLWSKLANKARYRTTPAVFTNGVAAIGDVDGTLAFYDVKTGAEVWKPWYKAGKKILAPAVSFGRQVFFVAEKKVIVLDDGSELWKQTELGGRSLSAPALSANSLYISAVDGLYRFSFDLSSFTKNSTIRGGVSSPAIGNDGTLYVMDLQKTLWAI